MSRYILLQGPSSPFFRYLTRSLNSRGHEVLKVNFNLGDDLYYPFGNIRRYRGTRAGWPEYFRELLREQPCDGVLVYGDCRWMHQLAKDICREMRVPFVALEEGYLRPDWVTIEREGVNGFSRLREEFMGQRPKKSPVIRENERARWPQVNRVIGGTMVRRIILFAAYDLAIACGKFIYPFYRHHRPIRVWGILPWLRSAFRHWYFRVTERGFLQRVVPEGTPFFLVPLQVWYDSQLRVHSPFRSIHDFIAKAMGSFAHSAPAGVHLVIKHHPMDRGEVCYARFIRDEANRLGVTGRVHYVHDLHLPTLIKRARGVVSMNSTVAFSALCHGTPVKLLGRAMFDIPDITTQYSLDRFWKNPGHINRNKLLAYREMILQRTQVNGNFFKALKPTAEGIATKLIKKTVRPSGKFAFWRDPKMIFEKCCYIGLGDDGLAEAAVMASSGIQVIGIDSDPILIAAINSGRINTNDDAVRNLVVSMVKGGSLSASLPPVLASVYVISTDSKRGAGPFEHDIDRLREVIARIAPYLASGNLVVLESPLAPGLTRFVARSIAAIRPDLRVSGDDVKPDVYVACCPRENSAGRIVYRLLNKERMVAGLDQASTRRALSFYGQFLKGKCFPASLETAESLAKSWQGSQHAGNDMARAVENEKATNGRVLGDLIAV